MSIKETKVFVEKLGYPFTDIYEFSTNFIMEHDDNEKGWDIMASIEDLFTVAAQEENQVD